MSSRDGESSNKLWLVIFVLLSLLAHVVVILAFVLTSIYFPPPKMDLAAQKPPEVTLSLVPAPPPAPKQAKQPKRPIFLPTNPDAATTAHQNTPIESDNTTALKSQSQKARAPDSPLPDLTGKKNNSLDLQDTPYSPPTPQPQTASNQPTKQSQQQQPQQPQPPTPPQPKQPAQPTQAQQSQPQPQPSPPSPTPPPPNPTKTPSQQIAKNTAIDPNGLPVLPPIAAPTMAPQTPVTVAQQMQNQTAARPPPSFQLNKSDVAGSQGALGNNSPAANATELGRYKAKFYRAVGSRWYAKVGQSFQILPVGTIRIQYTIHSDGIVDNIKILEGSSSALQLLMAISQNSITEASPFDPFPDGMRRQVGDSYTDDFTFSIYGG